MSYETVYSVRIKYAVDGRGATGVRGLTNEVRTLGREAGRVTGLFHRMGGAVAGYFGARAATKALLGFNATAQDAKVQIAGMLALAKQTNLSDEAGRAERLYGRLQQRAKELPGSTADYVQMAGMLAQPITDAGLGMKDLEDLTVNATVAAKALGYAWDLAGRDIDQALRGQFHSTDPFAGKVLGSIGYKGEEGRKRFNELDASQRAAELKRALMQKQWTQLAAAQANTFNGVLSTLQDTIAQFGGKVGAPLFKAITAELKRWNTWLDDNEAKVDAFAQKLADGLVTGFRAVKDAVGYLVDHADTLLMIAKAWAAVKIGNMIGGGIAGLGNSIGGLLAGGGGAMGFAGKAGLAGQALGFGYAIGTIFNDATGASAALADGLAHMTGKVDATTDKYNLLMRSMQSFDEALVDTKQRLKQGKVAGAAGTEQAARLQTMEDIAGRQAQVLLEANQISGGVGPFSRAEMQRIALQRSGLFDDDEIRDAIGKGLITYRSSVLDKQDAFRQRREAATITADRAWEQLPADIKENVDKQTVLANLMIETLRAMPTLKNQGDFVSAIELNRQAVEHALAASGYDPNSPKRGIASKGTNVNVTISRIEVQSDDPDRYAFGLVEAFRDAVKNPSAAVRAIREG